MPSYQDIETRLQTIELKVDFVMRSMVQQTTRQTGFIDPATGRPTVIVESKNLLQLYQEYRNVQLQTAAAKAAWDKRSSEHPGTEGTEGGGDIESSTPERDASPNPGPARTSPDSTILLTDN